LLWYCFLKSKIFKKTVFFLQAKTRGLPDDHSGPVRVVEIGQSEEKVIGGNGVNVVGDDNVVDDVSVVGNDNVVGNVDVVGDGDKLDSNLCCGTHLSNLAQLQVIKLLNTENSKRWVMVIYSFILITNLLTFKLC
jgi:Ser-tRNA(Ala) deacylase AlaX